MALPNGAMRWSVVCDYVISWSYSLTFFYIFFLGGADCVNLAPTEFFSFQLHCIFKSAEKASEYDQEIPQPHTADQPMAP